VKLITDGYALRPCGDRLDGWYVGRPLGGASGGGQNAPMTDQLGAAVRHLVPGREPTAENRHTHTHTVISIPSVTSLNSLYTLSHYYRISKQRLLAGLSGRVVSASDCGVRGSRFESRR